MVVKFRGTGAFAYSALASEHYGELLYVVPKGYIVEFKTGNYVVIQDGFLFNGADVPRAVWSLIPPIGDYTQAVQVHDKLCETLTVRDKHGELLSVTRKEADKMFFDCLESLGVGKIRLSLFKAGVNAARLFNFKKNKPNIRPNKYAVEKRALLAYKEGDAECQICL